MPLRPATIDAAATRLVLSRAGEETTFAHGRDFIVNTGGAGAFHDFAGTLLFAGVPATAERALADRADLDGQVIVVLGPLGNEAGTLIPDWIRRGAKGVVALIPDRERFDVFVRTRGDVRYFTQADVADPIWQPDLPILLAGPRLSAAILQGAPLTPDALDGTRPFHALPLERSVDVTIRVAIEPVEAANIGGLLPGADSTLRDEVVVFTAHYDHLGIGAADSAGDSIYNGFSDNAAGVAMLLAIAEALRDDPPARSVLFLFFTGEERGLIGSSYYAAAPAVPLERTVAVINLDAGAPPAPPRSWRLAGGQLSSLGELARDIAAARGWTAEPGGASPNSDHWPFLRRGVPALFIIPGNEWEGVEGAEREALRRRWDRYHKPGDEWSESFPFAGLQRYAEYALLIGRAVADAPQRPHMTASGER